MQVATIAFKVNKNAEKAIVQKHPWVFSNSIVKQSKEGEAGDLCIIFKNSNNKLLAVGLLDPDSPIRIKVLQVGSSLVIDENFFENRFSKAYSRRESLIKNNTSAYRLIYGENDNLPGLVIDIYDYVGVIKLYSSIWQPYIELIKLALLKVSSVNCIVLRLSRNLIQNSPLKEGILIGKLDSENVLFEEHGVLFSANPLKGHKTGYFLDHRANRLNTRNLSKGKHVLDVFSYAGGFTVNALIGGAKSVTSVDISRHALDLAKDNIHLNLKSSNHKTICGNAFEILEELVNKKKEFGLVIIDPPSFAKSQKEIPKALLSYKKLVKLGIPLTSQNGILLMASCSSRINSEEFYDLVLNEVSRSKRNFKILKKTTHDIDHPEGIPELNYLKSIYVQFD